MISRIFVDRHCQIFTSFILDQIQTFCDSSFMFLSRFSASSKIKLNLSFFLAIDSYNANIISTNQILNCYIVLIIFAYSCNTYISINSQSIYKIISKTIFVCIISSLFNLNYQAIDRRPISKCKLRLIINICA